MTYIKSVLFYRHATRIANNENGARLLKASVDEKIKELKDTVTGYFSIHSKMFCGTNVILDLSFCRLSNLLF